MAASIYNIPTDAQATGDSTVVLSIPTYVDEAPSMYTHADQPAAPPQDTVLETADHVDETRVEAQLEANIADTYSETASTPDALPAALAATVVHQTRNERRNKKQNRSDRSSDQAPAPFVAITPEVEEIVDSLLPVDQTTPLSPADDPHNADWKDYWPSNELVMYAVLDPSTAQAPTIDGVRLIRTQAQITEIDPDTSDIGIVAKVPVQILPMARGYEPLYNEITRARRLKQRVRPFMVEMRGVCKRLADQDTRFATARRTTLFGMQISTVKRIDKNQMQFGRWRGRGTVSAVRTFELDGVDYYRVTLEVASTKKKVFLRGESAQVDPVDVLIRKDHQHVHRFRRVGQRLLVEAEITAQTSIMRDTHPALEGLDDETRQRLATLRQGIVLANMGEFPDAQAEQDFANWQRSGAGNAGRPGRGRRPDGTGTGRNGNMAPRQAKQQNTRQLHRKQQRPSTRNEQGEVVAEAMADHHERAYDQVQIAEGI